MSLKVPFAAVLRILRGWKGLTQEGFPEKSSRQYLGGLEQGKSSITVDKLYALSQAMGLSPATILALTMAIEGDQDVEVVLQRIAEELRAFENSGGLAEAKAQIEHGLLVGRPAGIAVNAELLKNVLQCKAKGMTQKETSLELGVSKVTVHRYWKHDRSE